MQIPHHGTQVYPFLADYDDLNPSLFQADDLRVGRTFCCIDQAAGWPGFEKVAFQMQVRHRNHADLDGILLQAARFTFLAQLCGFDRQLWIFIQQRAPADHDRVRVGAQAVNAGFVCCRGDGCAFASDGVDFPICAHGDVHRDVGAVHERYSNRFYPIWMYEVCMKNLGPGRWDMSQ